MRDFYREIVESAGRLPSGVRLADEASLLVTVLSEDPDWFEWANTVIVEHVHTILRQSLRSQRASYFHGEGVRRFEKSIAEGVPYTSPYDVQYAVSGVWKRLGDMTGPDLDTAARGFESRAKAEMLQASFLRAVQERTGTGRVSDALTEEQIEQVRKALFEDEMYV